MPNAVKKCVFMFALTAALFLLHACGGNGAASVAEGNPVEIRYASNLEMEEHEGFTVAKIRNPWDTTKTLQTYILLENGFRRPAGYPSAEVINVPLRKSVVFSVVHNSLIHELGAEDAVSGVCDTEYVLQPWLKERLANGKTEDCGNSMSPNVEKILKLSPGAVLLSPFENSNGHGKLGAAGIPIVECADYMETSPLGRAEWMKFYGRLYGEKEKADSLFNKTEKEYLELKGSASVAASRPKVLLDRIYGQSWNVPGGNSTMGIMLKDAGAVNPFESYKVSGSLQFSPEKVLMEAGDADIWLIRYAYNNVTMKSLASDKPLYTKFKAYKDGNVYGSDTSVTHLFDDMAFHPQWILGDMISLLHPEIDIPDDGKNYFVKLKKE